MLNDCMLETSVSLECMPGRRTCTSFAQAASLSHGDQVILSGTGREEHGDLLDEGKSA